jgi:raffinose/stachyose/melibiose transport system permease protein
MNRYTWRTGLTEAAMVGLGILFLLPVYILVNLSVRQQNDLTSPLIPTTSPTLENFVRAWEAGRLGSALFTTSYIVIISVALLVVVGALAAYPLARMTTKFARHAYMLFMVGLLVPYQLVFIPLYQTFSNIGLLGGQAPIALIIFYVGHHLPFTIFLFASFLRAIPTDYDEAASIDGATRLQIFRYVLFPLLGPITGTVVIMNTIFIWNDLMTPLLYLSGSRNLTLPVAIYSFVGEYASDWSTIFAGLVISMLPVLIAYIVLQNRIMQGFSAGVKG